MSTKEEKKNILVNGLKDEKNTVNKRIAHILLKKELDDLDGVMLPYLSNRRVEIDKSINVLKK